MEERRRLAYLEAMGFEPLVPRLRLPGAHPSPRCAIAPLPAPAAEQPAQPAAASPPEARMPALEPTPPPRARRPETAPLRRPPRPVGERFAFTVGLVPGRLLLLDDGGAGGAEYRQLLVNFTRALLGPDAAALQREVFRWPVVNSPALDQSRVAAREALQALVMAQAEKHQLRALLLMGETPAALLLPELPDSGVVLRQDSLPLPVLVTDSGPNMLREPARKRRVWREVQPLLELLAQ